jgi:transposase
MPAPRKYPDELCQRAVEMVLHRRAERGTSYGVIPAVAREMGVGEQSLRQWVKRDDAERVPSPPPYSRRVAELERENEELRRANGILREATAFFARELDPQPPVS